MEFSERLVYLLVGGLFGFILGYIVRYLQVIKEELDEVDQKVTDIRDEGGFMRKPLIADIVVLFLVVISAGAAIQTARINETLRDTVECIVDYNNHQALAVASRDKAVEDGAQSEIDLWRKYAELYALAKKDPTAIPRAQEQLNRAINSHRRALENLQERRDDFPYANPDFIRNCER